VDDVCVLWGDASDIVRWSNLAFCRVLKAPPRPISLSVARDGG